MLNGHRPLLVSEARARFSELIEQVMAQPGTTVVIGHRDRQRSAVLVDAAHYQLLLEKAKIVDSPPGEPFRLAGSIEILVSDNELEAGIAAERRKQAELAAAKFSDL
jgi:prevent-host-death family protein